MTDTTTTAPPPEVPAIDVDALREKYRLERERRLRADGNAQYVEAAGQFAHYLDDPYADPGFTRAPVSEHVEVLIAGGGFGGLLTAARLVGVGIEDFRIVEQAGDFGGDFEVDLVNDGWTDLIGNILLAARRRAKAGEVVEDPETLVQLADYQKMEQVRARIDAIVKDEATAEALKPWYNQFCKRPCFHDDYHDTFNRPNVTLVDTQGRGVDEITENAVVVDGKTYELDCLIYGTGFEVGT